MNLMRRNVIILMLTLFSAFLCAESRVVMLSPGGVVSGEFSLIDSVPYYEMRRGRTPVVRPGRMGFLLADGSRLDCGFVIDTVESGTIDERWSPVLGQYDTIRNYCRFYRIALRQPASRRTMTVEFRLYDEGMAFRYLFDNPWNGTTHFRIAEERTEFAMSGDHKAFWLPGNFDSNEYYYTTSRLSDIDATSVDGSAIGTHRVLDPDMVQTPLMMKTRGGLYVSLFEAALDDYPAMHLLLDRQRLSFRVVLSPSPVPGVRAFMQTPCRTPWRTLMVSDRAEDILASSMILNLNDPCRLTDTRWIKPIKYVGVWWEMHIPGGSAWSYADVPGVKIGQTDWTALKPHGRHGAITANVLRYIDFAADNGLDAVLVEGWNVGWEEWSGNWKENVFDFVTPYPDFDIDSVTSYARSRGVELIMHHETSGSATNYERRMTEAFDFMERYGYKSLKTGYVGWPIPRGETHDGQWMVNHYNRVVREAAERHIMVNAHEPVRPTGLSRTYPNLLACEAARGNEFNAWSKGNPPEHETILPFTRLLGGGMDYTPGIFEIKMSHYQEGNSCQVHTTLAKQLALYVTMYSPIQMAADLPENYLRRMDAFQFIRDVECDWTDTRILEAEPGDYITVARRGKRSGDWFIGAITDERGRKARIDLSFLDPGCFYVATVYADAPDADWKDNPMAYEIRQYIVDRRTKFRQRLAPGGGCAISLRRATLDDLSRIKDKL